jgi:hypothetical protein
MQVGIMGSSNNSDSQREHVMIRFFITVIALITLAAPSFAGENLKLNPKLDYTSDSQDGPLITGDSMNAGFIAGKPAYVIMYGEGCFNSKRQARRTVDLYEMYKGRVQFVIIDIDHRLSREQEELKKKYFRGYIPHVVVLDASGSALYNRSGEVDGAIISGLLDKTLR